MTELSQLAQSGRVQEACLFTFQCEQEGLALVLLETCSAQMICKIYQLAEIS